MGKQWKQCQTLFLGALKSLQMVIAAMKLKDAQNFSFARWISTEDLLYNSVSIVNSVVSYTSNWRNPVSPNVAFWIIIIQYQNKETDMATIYMYISTSFYHMCWLVQAISIQTIQSTQKYSLYCPFIVTFHPLCYAMLSHFSRVRLFATPSYFLGIPNPWQ